MLDFSEWELQDTGSLYVSLGRVSWKKADRTIVRYLGRPLKISGDFVHSFDVCILEGEVEDELNRGFIRLWEVRNDWENRTWVYARKDGDGWTIHFEQLDLNEKSFEFHGSSQLQFKRRYSVKISRIGEAYRLDVIDESGSVIEESNEIVGKRHSYRNLWLASTIKSRRNNGNWSTGFIENLIIK